MKYRLHIRISDADYLRINQLIQHQMPEGKKMVRLLRILIAAIFLGASAVLLIRDGLTPLSMIIIAGWLIMIFVMQLFVKPYLNWALKARIKNLKKKCKKLYSPESVMEFYEAYFLETAEQNQAKRMYSSIERVSIIEGEAVFIHEGLTTAYIIPYSCFESEEQYREFVAFVKEKFAKVDCY